MNARLAHYLDHNASAPLLPESQAAIVSALESIGNPSSVHMAGRAVRALVDDARELVAEAAGAKAKQIVFTGSATEAITQAIAAGAATLNVDEVIVSAGEHTAALKATEASGKPFRIIGLTPDGLIDLDALRLAIGALAETGRTGLVAVHLVNNETGVVQPIAEIEALVGPTPHFLFVDAVQAFGKQPLDFAARAADMMAISAHKIGGPAGVGALLVKEHCDTVRLIPGGGQEQGRRGGTEPVSLIAGFGAAAERFPIAYETAHVTDLSMRLEDGLRNHYPDVAIFGGTVDRIGNTVNFALPGYKASVAMMGLDLEGIAVSSGSACSSGKVGKSHVLEAMSVAPDLMPCALRISFGWSSREDDVDVFLQTFATLVDRHKKRQGEAA